MRLSWILVLLAGCSLYLGGDKKKLPPDAAQIDDAPYVMDEMWPDCGPAPADAGVCACDYGQWRCNTCPWPSPQAVIPCTQIGASCEYEDWEHGCSCVCDASGYWSCEPETVGSYCPHVPYPDAAPQ